MKAIRLILLSLLMISLSSCSFLYYGDNNKQMDIREGMTKEQVRSMLGAPDLRRFENNIEEWEYRGARITVVRFRKDKVLGMDMFTPHTCGPLPPPLQVEVSNN